MRSAFLSVLLALAFGAAFPSAAFAASQTVQFAKGADSATLKGSVVGDRFMDYKLRANAGQTMTVDLAASNPSLYFNVLPPGSNDVAIYNSSTASNQWTGRLDQSGDYTIRVYLFRNEARRGTKATYTLKVGIIDQ